MAELPGIDLIKDLQYAFVQRLLDIQKQAQKMEEIRALIETKKAKGRKHIIGTTEQNESEPYKYSFEMEAFQHAESSMRRTNDFRSTQTALNKTFTNYRI